MLLLNSQNTYHHSLLTCRGVNSRSSGISSPDFGLFRSGVIEEDEFHLALTSLVDSKTVDQIINHPELGRDS